MQDAVTLVSTENVQVDKSICHVHSFTIEWPVNFGPATSMSDLEWIFKIHFPRELGKFSWSCNGIINFCLPQQS